MEKLIVIYGASSGGIKVAKTLQSFHIDFHCFIDTNRELWGTLVLGKRVYEPEYLIDKECQIIIASDAGYSEIKERLREINKETSCIQKEELILPKVNEIYENLKDELDISKQQTIEKTENTQKNVFLELMEGYQLGGIENWSYIVAKGLKEKKCNATILCRPVLGMPITWQDIVYDEFNGDYAYYKETIIEILLFLKEQLPCTLLLNKHQQVMYAGYILKKLYPDKIRLISVVHNDLFSLYDRHTFIDDVLDGYFCVSKKIKNTLKQRYHIPEHRLFNKESPVVFENDGNKLSNVQKSDDYNRTYFTKENAIRIAYGARLEKVQKRADLLIPLIEELNELGCNYLFDIAGEGPYLEIINEYVRTNHLSERVKIHGIVRHEDMKNFWMNADVFVSVSQMEGLSISMLESMYCGAVPVMFEVAGCEEFIEDGVNGFILPYEDYRGVAQKINFLSKNKEMVENMGKDIEKIVKERCNLSDYIDYITEIVM